MKTRFRERQNVRVVTPKFFLRCGYTLDVSETANKIIAEHTTLLSTLVGTVVGFVNKEDYKKHILKIAKELAYLHCKKHKWGGQTRSIFTQDMPGLQGAQTHIIELRRVSTGVYCPRIGGQFEDDESSPAHLTDTKFHQIAYLALYGPDYKFPHVWMPIETQYLEICDESSDA